MEANHDQPTNRDNKQLLTTRILWGAITAALLVYVSITLIIPAPPATLGKTLDLLVLLLAIVATGLTGAVVVLPRLLAGKLPALQLSIARWALSESVGIFGLLLHFLGAPQSIALSFFSWSFLLLVALFPRQRHLA